MNHEAQRMLGTWKAVPTKDVEVGSQGIPILESGRNLAEESSKTRRLPDSLTVVTFYTEGPPQDDCLPLTHVVEELRKLLKLHGGEVQLLSYTPRSLVEDDFYRKHCCPSRSESGMEPYMELLPHAHKLGYYAWKPLVICKALSQVEPGAILLFMDANLQKYQDYREGLQDLRKTCRKLLERTDFFVPLEDPMWKRIQNHCKALTLELMDANTFKVAFAPCICVNRILMRRTALVERLMQDWLHWCGQSDVICPIPNPKPHPLCLFHTPEQAILAILVRKLVLQKQLPAGWPFYSYAPGTRIFHLDFLEDWPMPFLMRCCRRFTAMFFFLQHALFAFRYPKEHHFWRQFQRATPSYLLKFAWRGFLMSLIPLPEHC